MISMFRIMTEDKTLYTDAIRYIRLHKNGCYVACPQEQAEGVCAKVHEEMDEVGMVLDDSVFVFTEGAMHGTEPVCVSLEKDIEITTEMLQEGHNAKEALAVLMGEKE